MMRCKRGRTERMVVVAGLCLLSLASGAFAKQPNFLLVVVDDLGWTDLGSFGSEIDTPNLDALAQQGVAFNQFYVSVSCSPTRSMLMSGTDNHIAGLGNMRELMAPEQEGKPGYEGYLNDRVVSLAEVLREGGYHTYMAGKWHLGSREPKRYPHGRGFERSFSMLYGGASYWPDKFGLFPKEATAKYVVDDKEVTELPGDFYATHSYTDFLIDAIRENRGDGRPFLAYLAYTAPHDPLHVPEPWLSRYRGDYDDGFEVLKKKRALRARELGLVPASAQAPDPTKHPEVRAWDSLLRQEQALRSRAMEVYAGMVSNTDYHFGRIVDFLKDIGEYENTVIIFLSDNGPNPWSSENYPGVRNSKWFEQFDNRIENLGHPMSHFAYGIGWSAASTGPLGLAKMTVGEGGIRSPLIISGPGVKGGRRVGSLSYVTDIMPTILEFAGLEHPEEFRGREVEPMRGRSIAGILSGAQTEVYGADDFVGGEMLNGKWMRQGDIKALSVAPPFGSGQWELYNVVKDPGETRNLAKEKPKILARLIAAWNRWADEVGVVLSK